MVNFLKHFFVYVRYQPLLTAVDIVSPSEYEQLQNTGQRSLTKAKVLRASDVLNASADRYDRLCAVK